MAASLKTFTDQNFSDEVLSANLPVIVDFWAEWCGPCKMLTPILEDLAPELEDKVIIGKLDVDANPQTASKYGINSIPTMLFFKDGQIVEQHTGLLAKAALKTKIESVFE
ncbi:thioredoxin [Chitinispirillales bacterium ANBcel5]|uniref:thioredoxin n=1 Tax=Cellulosispirillum alkaliphilum TaxID=3039283 RepID=UPI002A575F44|nr:thioredoxin [Chitinispirillales bacterium ANBcel5]